MKKLMTTATSTLLTLCVNLYAQQPSSLSPYGGGPRDNIFAAKHIQPGKNGDNQYRSALDWTTLGPLARYSDIIGVGQVSQQQTNGPFIVTVDHALVGCTNGAAIKMYGEWNGVKIFEELFEGGSPQNSHFCFLIFDFPTNESRIVFAVSTNDYRHSTSYENMFWNHTKIPETLSDIDEGNRLRYLNRSWWYVDRDDGLLFTQFTNVIQAVRFDRNWTNYFYLCYNGANSPSNRVREDSSKDMSGIFNRATDEQAQFILDDPLIDQKHKDWLIRIRPHLQGN